MNSGKELTLAQVAIPTRDETKHFMIFGGPGTGKSTAIHELLSGALERGDRAIVTDCHGSHLSRHYDASRGDVILNPFHPHSVKWDPLREISQPYDVDRLARALIPDAGSSAERSWRNYGRIFFTAVASRAHASGISDAGELYRLLVVAQTDELKKLVAGTAAEPFLRKGAVRMYSAIHTVVSSAVNGLRYVAEQEAPSFSIRNWVASGNPNSQSVGQSGAARGGVLFIPYGSTEVPTLSPMISAWIRLGMDEAMNQNKHEDQRLWFIVDGLDDAGHIDTLNGALSALGKYGGRVVLGSRSITELSGTYGRDYTEAMMERCGNRLILRCPGISEFSGNRVSRTQIEDLPDLKGYLRFASHPAVWRRADLPSANYPRVNDVSQAHAASSVISAHRATATTATFVANVKKMAIEKWRVLKAQAAGQESGKTADRHRQITRDSSRGIDE
jgi:hypothetical protein